MMQLAVKGWLVSVLPSLVGSTSLRPMLCMTEYRVQSTLDATLDTYIFITPTGLPVNAARLQSPLQRQRFQAQCNGRLAFTQ
jgi:hypothetical protein